MLLPFVRRMIDGPVPIHGVVAPPDSAGTGKGLLVQTACVPGISEVPSTPEVGNGDELRKKLLPVILEDLPIFLFDNVTTELKGGVLASLLTARNWADRFLGRSELFRGHVSTAFAFTANGPRCSTEIRRRTNWVRLDAREPEPWRRTGFEHVLPAWAFQRRAELISACLTLVRNWQALGCPASAASLWSFERWAAIIGGILGAAEIDGFLGNLDDESVREADETGARWRGFVEDWWREHREQAVTPGALIDLAYGRSIIRENKDGEPEVKARSAATRLGLMFNRRVGEAFKVRLDDDAPAHVITLTRAKVERAKGGSHQGFALKLAEKPRSMLATLAASPKTAKNPRKITRVFPPTLEKTRRSILTTLAAEKVPNLLKNPQVRQRRQPRRAN
jgi:putative DNA primase/helicase